MIQNQGQRLHHHEHLLNSLAASMQELHANQGRFQSSLEDMISSLSHQAQGVVGAADPERTDASGPPSREGPTTETRFPVHEPRGIQIERYDGNPGTCRSFLTNCLLLFELNPSCYVTERARVASVITHLTGRAREWATAEWTKQSPVCQSYADFSSALTRVFDHGTPGRKSSRALLSLRQGKTRVLDYAIEFRTLAAESRWNNHALADVFHHGLADNIKDQLAPLDLPEDLDSLVDLAVRLDNRLMERSKERSSNVVRPPAQGEHHPEVTASRGGAPAHALSVEPMQVGHTRLSPGERQRRFKEGSCFYCGQPGHILAHCPAKDRAHQ